MSELEAVPWRGAGAKAKTAYHESSPPARVGVLRLSRVILHIMAPFFLYMVRRRNDIVHRADRPQTEPGGEAQGIAFAWTQQAVDTIKHICLALDEPVTARVVQPEAMISA